MICPHCQRDVDDDHFYGVGRARCVASTVVWTPAKIWKLMSLEEQGYGREEIARRLGVTVKAIESVKKRRGLPRAFEHYVTAAVVESRPF